MGRKHHRRRNTNKRNSERGSNNTRSTSSNNNEETTEGMANFNALTLADTNDVDETWQPYFHEETGMTDKLIKEDNVAALMRHHSEEIVSKHGFVDEQGVTWFPLLTTSTSTGANAGKQKNRCLGVPPCRIPGFVNLVGKDENSQYAKLPRPMVITPKPSCPIQLRDHPVEEGLIMKFWTGDFSVTFHNPYENGGGNLNCVDEDFFFCLQATATFAEDDDTDNYASFSLQIKRGSSSLVFGNQNRLSGVKGAFTTNLCGRLTEQQQGLIGGRIVHHFLRCHGWMVPDSGLFNMIEYSKARIQGKKKYTSEFLGICIVLADIMVNRPFCGITTPRLIGIAIFKVAEALSTMTKDVRDRECESSHYFREAFILYVEVAQRFMRNTPDEAEIYSAAAINARRCGLYTVTLNYAVYSLHLWAMGCAWDLSEEHTNWFICGLYMVQHEIDEPSENCWSPAGAASASMKLGTTILSAGLFELLRIAKFRPNIEGMDKFVECSSTPGTLLKPRYRTTPQAKRILRQLFQTSRTVEEYRQNLLALLKYDTIQYARKNMPPRKIEQVGLVNEEMLASKYKKSQKNDREYAKQQRPVTLQLCTGCGKPEEIPKTHRACSRCHMALYCSASCQENDWKHHKVDCKKFAKEYGKTEY